LLYWFYIKLQVSRDNTGYQLYFLRYYTMFNKFYFELPDKAFESEAKFTSRFWKQIINNKWFRHKISDQSSWNKPCDSIVWLFWKTFLLEIKVWKNKTKVDVFNMLRPNQKFFLQRRQDNWWTSIVIYYSKYHNEYTVMNYSNDMILTFSK